MFHSLVQTSDGWVYFGGESNSDISGDKTEIATVGTLIIGL
jgi:hypothetical protein